MVRLMGYVYIPIALFVVFVFFLVVYYRERIAKTQAELSNLPPTHVLTSSTSPLSE